MRRLLVILALIALGITGTQWSCRHDATQQCAQAYAHLLELAKRQGSPKEKERFVNACKDAWDEARWKCLMDAKTVEQALDCKPSKIRPG